jgi:hypothetical protein
MVAGEEAVHELVGVQHANVFVGDDHLVLPASHCQERSRNAGDAKADRAATSLRVSSEVAVAVAELLVPEFGTALRQVGAAAFSGGRCASLHGVNRGACRASEEKQMRMAFLPSLSLPPPSGASE